MAWKNGYYYRNRRINGRVVSEYHGTGYGAELVAQLDAHERQQDEVRRKAWQELRQRQAALDKLVDDVGDLVTPLLEAVLLTTGHHQHKRQWRRKRDSSE
jgi:hypothetical protein